MAYSPVRYVKSGDEHIAYRTMGTGSRDLLMILPSVVGTIELIVEPPASRMAEGMERFARVISFDRRGTGSSDPLERPPTLEEQMADVIAVLDAVSAPRVSITAEAEAASLAVMFAATHPERVKHLVLLHPMARLTRAEGYEFAQTDEEREERLVKHAYNVWGSGEGGRQLAPVLMERDPEFLDWWGRWERLSTPPGVMRGKMSLLGKVDVREILPRVQAPTLVLDRPDAQGMDSQHAAYVAAHIPGAEFEELPGRDAISFGEGLPEYLDALERFITGTNAPRKQSRALATVLFTDIVGSTERASELGDSAWRQTLEKHDRITRVPSTPTGAERSSRRATASSRPSTARLAPSAARPRSAAKSASSGFSCAPGCTRARSS